MTFISTCPSGAFMLCHVCGELVHFDGKFFD